MCGNGIRCIGKYIYDYVYTDKTALKIDALSGIKTLCLTSENGQKQIKESIAIYKKNAAVLMESLDKSKIKYFGGKNAPYVWMKCTDKMKSWKFFDFLLTKADIIGTPGADFGICGEGYFRLSSFGNPDDTALAAERISKLFEEEI